jgi:SAM-dependent methyltransferase
MNAIIFIGIAMGMLTAQGQTSEGLITHYDEDTSLNLTDYKRNLEKQVNKALPFDEEIKLLEQLSQFELGRFLLKNKGLNGYWTSYIILHGPQKADLHPLENWLLHDAPAVKATQERFNIFQKLLQSRLKDNLKIASIPCGLMDDLLRLDYSSVKNIQLVGIDLDEKSLELAHANAQNLNVDHTQFLKRDAWQINLQEEFDIIMSNGLNIYEPNDDRVINLYKQFFSALKPGGVLIVSFLTPPPGLSKESTWKNVKAEDAQKQKAIFNDIIGVAWQAFRTEAQTCAQLEQAEFQVLEVIYDSQGIFPTVVAQKKSKNT